MELSEGPQPEFGFIARKINWPTPPCGVNLKGLYDGLYCAPRKASDSHVVETSKPITLEYVPPPVCIATSKSDVGLHHLWDPGSGPSPAYRRDYKFYPPTSDVCFSFSLCLCPTFTDAHLIHPCTVVSSQPAGRFYVFALNALRWYTVSKLRRGHPVSPGAPGLQI